MRNLEFLTTLCADFLTTLCALYSFINALYVELVRKIIILRGGGGKRKAGVSWWIN